MTSKTPALQAEAFLHGLELYRKVVILNRGIFWVFLLKVPLVKFSDEMVH